ncbi:hypothetical protein PTTG_26945 [Puccinia triticina 1-1 BBBD Race 1]|uniref:Uncharacterized protein n=1 Tax=Puccinia triticina (isolate 1-1 / race 1 (BBBD)) TaxID=630390 RepID=A0A180GQ37_PUCT1|nr:hypothetical protein PTTG_26945 [Puccinia triticina 1-1 BBBD Race 1]
MYSPKFLFQLSSTCVLLAISNPIQAPPPISDFRPGDIGSVAVAHDDNPSQINIEESECDGKTLGLGLSEFGPDLLDPHLEWRPTREVKADNPRAATLDSSYKGETRKSIGSSHLIPPDGPFPTRILDMPYYIPEALNRHDQRRNPEGSQYGVVLPAASATQNSDRRTAENKNYYQLFPITSPRFKTERNGNPSPSTQGPLVDIRSNVFVSVGPTPPKAPPIRIDNLHLDHSSLTSHVNKIPLSVLEKATNHRGSNLPPPPGFQQSHPLPLSLEKATNHRGSNLPPPPGFQQLHPLPFSSGKGSTISDGGLYDGQTNFVPGLHGREAFTPAYAHGQGDLSLSSAISPPKHHFSGNMETQDLHNSRNLGFQSLDNSGPAKSGILHEKQNAMAAHSEDLRGVINGKEKNIDRNPGHSPFQTSTLVTSIRKTSVSPSTDSSRKDETPKASKLNFDDQPPRLSQKQAKAGNSIEPGPSAAAVPLPEAGDNRARPTLGDFLVVSAKNGKADILKANQRNGEQRLSKALEAKFGEAQRKEKASDTLLPDREMKKIIQNLQAERYSREKKGTETKSGKDTPAASEADQNAERQKRLAKQKEWEASSVGKDKMRRDKKAKAATGEHVAQDIRHNQNFPIVENEASKTLSRDESTQLDAQNSQGGSSGANRNGPQPILSSKDKVDRTRSATDENFKNTLQAQDTASLESAGPRTDESILDRSAWKQGQRYDNLSHLSAMPSCSRNLQKEQEVSGEEMEILRLIESKKKPRNPIKPTPTPPLYFKVNYAMEETILSEMYEEYKQTLNPINFKTKPTNSIMAPLEIKNFGLQPEIAKVFSELLAEELRHEDLVLTKPLQSSHLSASALTEFSQLWGEETVLDWKNKSLDVSLMARLALILNLDCKKPHYGISPDASQLTALYERFRAANHTKESLKLSKVETSIRKLLGQAESNRRFAALLICLQEETYARNWRFWKKHLMGKKLIQKSDATRLENRLGVSTDATSNVNIPNGSRHYGMNVRFGKSDCSVTEMLVVICGADEAKRRLEFVEYLDKRIYRTRWWKSFDLEAARKKYGLNLHTIVQVGDSLQFVFKYFPRKYESWDWTEKNFVELKNFLQRVYARLSWMESSERAWLHTACGGLYQDRLWIISQLYHNRCLKTNMPARIAYELIWFDLGLNIGVMTKLATRPQGIDAIRDNRIATGLSRYPQSAVLIWLRSFHMERHQYTRMRWTPLGEVMAHHCAAFNYFGGFRKCFFIYVVMLMYGVLQILQRKFPFSFNDLEIMLRQGF